MGKPTSHTASSRLSIPSPTADDPFHVTQLRVILDEADSLLEDFARYLGGENLNRGTAQSVIFSARLMLYIDYH